MFIRSPALRKTHNAFSAFEHMGILHKEIGVRESLLLSAGYARAALIFGAWVRWYLGAQSGLDHDTGFMMEKPLSMDKACWRRRPTDATVSPDR